MNRVTVAAGNTLAKRRFSAVLLTGTAMAMAAVPAYAQTADTPEATGTPGNEIVVSGIRGSLATALREKRESENLIEVIQAEDIGKLPDQNLAEVLENVTGVQITRQAGVGTAVQIRGTDANRTEINGVSTVGSGASRSGISFEDIPASIIASVEVVKVPDAKTIEGSVGGTINLRTIRPLDLNEPLIAARVQYENSDLADTTLPRISASIGNKWDTGIGEFGIVLSGSYSRTDVASFAPRVDLDNARLASTAPNLAGSNANQAFDYLQVQFLQQEVNRFNYETKTGTASVEWKPSSNLKLYFDATVNDQERAQAGNRVQVSGVSGAVDTAFHTGFQTINLGTIEDQQDGIIDLGTIQATSGGTIGVVGASGQTLDPNLRMSSDTGSRITRNRIFDLGFVWEGEKLTVRGEAALSTAKSTNPNFSTTLDFINPNSVQPVFGRGTLDNGTPVAFDLTGGSIRSGIDTSSPFAPTTAQLLDPANYQLQQVQQSANTADNEEKAARLDFSYDTTDLNKFITSVDFGYRWNQTTAIRNNFVNTISLTNNSTGSAGRFNRPEGNLFSDILIAAPSNFNAADGRTLFFSDFLIIDGGKAFNDPTSVLDTLNSAITASNTANPQFPAVPQLAGPTESAIGFFRIRETTNAAYFQANGEGDIFGMPARGNIGLRWLNTKLTSTGNNVVNNVAAGQIVRESEYSFVLPRFSLVVEPARDVIIRTGIARDIRRPDFDSLTTSYSYPGSATGVTSGGNPGLIPEAVWSFDLSGEYYFAPSSLISVGVFHKKRTNLFADTVDPAPAIGVNPNAGNGPIYSIDPTCPGGGIFNPLADRNLFSLTPGNGICQGLQSKFNVPGSTTQTGVEIAFQHDLSAYEDALGFASGFGVIGNFTYQEVGGAKSYNLAVLDVGRRTDTVLGFARGSLSNVAPLTNLSKYSYNATLFYDKFGLNARVRYTWRSSYANSDQFRWNMPIVAGARGQLNASINYDITDNINIGVEGINLLRGDQKLFCVNDNAVLCFQGLTDRRITAGLSVKF